MTYFRLGADVLLIAGAKRALLMEVGRGRTCHLTAAQSQALHRLQQNQALEDAVQASCCGEDQIDGLVEAGWGQYWQTPVFVDQYQYANDDTTRGLFEPSVTIRALYLQLQATCDKACRGCGDCRLPVWQGCNSCELWPAVVPGARWRANDLAAFIRDLDGLDVRTVVFSGGNPLLCDDLLMAAVTQLRTASRSMRMVVVTNGYGLTRSLADALKLSDVTINVVIGSRLGGGPIGMDAERAIALCRDTSIPFYLTLDVSADAEDGSRTRSVEDVPPRGELRVVRAERVVVTSSGGAIPLAVVKRGRERLRDVKAPEVFRRALVHPCLNGLVAVTADAAVRICPMVSSSMTERSPGSVRRMLRERRHTKYWHLTKDSIDGCRTCEYRLACVDCAAVDLVRSHVTGLDAALCDYRPSAGCWGTDGKVGT